MSRSGDLLSLTCVGLKQTRCVQREAGGGSQVDLGEVFFPTG